MSENLLEVSGLEKHFPITKGLFKRTVGHVRDAQPAPVDEQSQLIDELLDPGVEFIRQSLPTRHSFPTSPNHGPVFHRHGRESGGEGVGAATTTPRTRVERFPSHSAHTVPEWSLPCHSGPRTVEQRVPVHKG